MRNITKEETNVQEQERQPREIVLPGELLAEGGFQAGNGAYKDGESVYSEHLGLKDVRGKYIGVIPLNGRYIPRVGDSVVGKVVEVNQSSWLIDINSPYPAPLGVRESPWEVEFGDTARFLTVGDVVIVEVTSIDEAKKVQVTMRGPGLRKLAGGTVMEVSPVKVPRIIGKNASMISLVRKYTDAVMVVGKNGRIWLNTDVGKMEGVIRIIRQIEEEAHIPGLTSRIQKTLAETYGEPAPQARPDAGEVKERPQISDGGGIGE